MSMELALQTYLAESRGLLHDMEEALLSLERSPADQEVIDTLFRAAHTIKGSAGLFGLDVIVAFTHVVENVLERLRAGEILISKALVSVMLACIDHTAALLDSVDDPAMKLDAMRLARGEQLVQELQPFLAIPSDTGAGPTGNQAESPDVHDTADESANLWSVSIQFGENVLRNGMDPVSFIRYLATIGRIQDIRVNASRMPAIEKMDAESCYLGIDMLVSSSADRKTIEDVFEFVRDDCELKIEPGSPSEPSVTSDPTSDPEDVIGLDTNSLEPSDPDQHVPQQVVGLTSGEGRSPLSSTKPARFIRVNAEKLDQLINLVGELVIAGASGALLARRSGNTALQEASAAINGYIEQIREGALGLRMVEIGETFKRFQRVVREVSQELGKDIMLEIGGADTELDKTVVEQIGDPLTHLVRNAIDHGIEPEAIRLAQGKPAQGVVSLNAYHDSGSIVIEVTDDGGGLSTDKIRNKAIERGVIKPTDVLSDREIFNLIFEPGFSTAETITNLSGRGVGMDVVRKNIEALRGSVDIDSKEGTGTTVRIRLPLTLAIIDGFLFSVGSASYVIPLDVVLECMELSAEDVRANPDRHYFNLRGEVLPFMRLRELFGIVGKKGRRENIIVVQCGGHKAGLVVDDLLGEFQTVIKPLGKIFSHVRGVTGSTILGSGEVALILDVPSLVALAVEGERAHEAIPQAAVLP